MTNARRYRLWHLGGAATLMMAPLAGAAGCDSDVETNNGAAGGGAEGGAGASGGAGGAEGGAGGAEGGAGGGLIRNRIRAGPLGRGKRGICALSGRRWRWPKPQPRTGRS